MTNADPKLGVFRITPEAILPSIATNGSACFDIHVCLLPTDMVASFNRLNQPEKVSVGPDRMILIEPGKRYLIPTGLIFDIPEGFSVRFHPRSGNALKKGLILANCEGVIDSDYVGPVFAILINISSQVLSLSHGDRVCQAELVYNQELLIQETNDKPLPKSKRAGGFGSTGA